MVTQIRKRYNLDYINILRIIALVLVILAHSSAVYTGAWAFKLVNNKSESIKYITNYFQTIRMPLFVFISGYLYHFNRVKLNKYNSFSRFVRNKAKRLLIPYLMTGIFFMIPVQMIFNIYSDNEGYFYKVFNEILLGNMPGHLWFLLALFHITIVFYLVEKYLKDKNIDLNPISIIILLSFIGFLTRNISNIYQIQSSIEYSIYFFIGYIFSENMEYIRNNVGNRRYILLIHALLFNIQYLLLNTVRNRTIYIKWFKFVLKQITSILGITFMFMYSLKFCENTERLDRIMSNNIIRLIDANKFYAYLLHQPVLKIVLVNIGDLNIKPFTVVNILFWSTLFISIFLSIIIKKLKRFLTDVFINSKYAEIES